MTPPDSPTRRLLVGGLVSLAAHAGALAVVVGVDGAHAPRRASTPADRAPPEERPGIDRSKAMTINWIGFEEPTEHRAPRAATEQPLLVRGPAPTPMPRSAAPAGEAGPPATDAGPAVATPTPRAPDGVLEAAARVADAVRDAARRLAGVVRAPTPVDPRPAADLAPLAPSIAVATPGGSAEASPTGLTDPIVIEPGEPAAVEGLTIRTVAPRFSTVTRLTARPHNPLIDITFETTGKVVQADIVQSSGYANVDRPVLDAVYQWRATGRRLTEIRAQRGPDARVTLRFRIVLR